jgi:predicted RNase H-like HicB family nuclease
MSIFKVPVVKSKGSVEIDYAQIPDDMLRHIIAAGLKVLVNGGTSKITKSTYPDEAELTTVAQAKAEERASEIIAGTLKVAGSKAKGKTPAKVMTEARRLAKAYIKDQMREQGLKISHYDAKEITAAANDLLESMPELIAQAEANLKQREEVPVATKLDLSSLMKVNPAKVQKATEANEKKKVLSAKQAGMTTKKKAKATQAQA